MVELRLIVFDCDGVILESVDAKTRAFGKAVEEFGVDASRRLVQHHLANGGVSRHVKFDWFYTEVLGRKITDSEMEYLSNVFTRCCYDEVLKAEFVPGAYEFIREYYAKVPMCVASGTPHAELMEIFEARGLSKYFREVLGAPPGKTELLQGIVKRSNADPLQTLMVGDSSTDLEAALAVGTKFYGRGDCFSSSGMIWGRDLTGLAAYIEKTFILPDVWSGLKFGDKANGWHRI